MPGETPEGGIRDRSRRRADGFRAGSSSSRPASSIAFPALEGLPALYGRSVFHCPYCDGWESRDRALAVYGRGKNGAGLALSLKTWSPDVTLLSNGHARLGPELQQVLATRRVAVDPSRIARLDPRRRGLDSRLPATASAGRSARSSSPPGRTTAATSPAGSDADSAQKGRSLRTGTSGPAFRGSTSRGTLRATFSSLSSRRPRARRRPLPSTGSCSRKRASRSRRYPGSLPNSAG